MSAPSKATDDVSLAVAAFREHEEAKFEGKSQGVVSKRKDDMERAIAKLLEHSTYEDRSRYFRETNDVHQYFVAKRQQP